MARHVGRHRARRQSPLRRPAVAATATLSALAVTGIAYSSGSAALEAGSPQAEKAEAALGLSATSRGATALDPMGTISARAKAQSARQKAAIKQRTDLATRLSASRGKSQTAATALRQAQTRAKAAEPTATQDPATDNPSADRASRSDAARPAFTGDPRSIARSMMSSYGWSQSQFACLNQLWIGESDWRHTATNPSSGAYGIPQSLPASKMASAGADWRTNPATQIRWGMGYIKERYGSPCGALNFWNNRYPHWY